MNAIFTSRSSAIQNYNFRFYSDNQKVFHIQRKLPDMITSSSYQNFSTPMYITKDKCIRNVLIAFPEQTYCNYVVSQLDNIDISELIIKDNSLKELKYMSDIMKVPLVVLMNASCDLEFKNEIFEVFYHNNKDVSLKSVFDREAIWDSQEGRGSRSCR